MLREIQEEGVDDSLLHLAHLRRIATSGESIHGFRHAADEIVIAQQVY